ncbi:uncharacterized protein Pyn_35508 [Prunus yedoensis var. nudiflora]|uniref:Uncharacterized protein n=1 Tax=Prunus yedoensis var. nudiflora TaxID=2094558 RepID=A0A314U5Y9_PRUYE|nr:uncharacterized protein Pyn_35508 [Prunus yedoensis var. nudiflora]
MDGCLEPIKNSNDQQSLGTSGNMLRQINASINLHDKPQSRKPSLSYADLHHEITRNVKDIPSNSVGNHQKQRINRKTTAEEEIVRHMSNLPSYLERGKNLQEKVLNVGVLDWGRLEKWQCSHKQMPYRSSRYSPSSSNTTSCFSTDGSSTHSSRGHSCSPARPRMHRHSLQSHFTKSPTEGHSEGVSSFGERVEKFQDLKADQSSTVNGPEKFIGTDTSLCRSRIDMKVEQCKSKDSDAKSEPENRSLWNGPHLEMAAHLKRFSRNNHSGVSHLSDSTTLLHQRAEKTTRASSSERPKEGCHAELNSDFPHSCHFPSEVESKHSRVKHLGSTDGLDLKPSKATAEKVRNTSPFRRFSIGVGKMSKNASSKDCLDTQQLSSTTFSAKPGSRNTATSTFLGASDGQKSNATGRAKSPLRRLLDPLLKSKVANSHHLVEPLEKDSILSEGRVDSLSEQPGKVKLGMTGCRTINVNEPVKAKKCGSSAVHQALLRVAVKNGLPLFTFAVDNDIDILAATIKTLNTLKKGDCSCIYTFFSIREVKKKSGTWINQGSKGKSHDYVRNVIAQMKVADSQFPNLVRPDHFSMREFVLFSGNLRQADCETSDFQPSDELAAAVVKIPKKVNQQSTGDWHHWDNCSNLPRIFDNQNPVSEKVKSHKVCSITDRFELFPQGGLQENQPTFSMSPFRDGIYSVEFSSSLSILQAFSICIAVLDRNLCEFSESRNSLEEKTSGESILTQTDGLSAPNRTEGEVPARYVSYPPLSPAGRV